MVEVINPVSGNEDKSNSTRSIFLAGPCPRDDSADWRDEAVELFKKYGFNGEIYNPTNRDYETMGPDAYTIQTNWERDHLHKANVVLFWVPRDLVKNPAFTTNVEFGYWMGKDSSKCVYGRPDESEKNTYLDWTFNKETGRSALNSLEDTVKEAIKLANSHL